MLKKEWLQKQSEQERYDLIKKNLTENNQLIYAGTLLERAARLYPAIPAIIISEENQITYHQLYEKASTISHHLMNAGVNPRDKVMILYENSINFYAAYYGAWQTGAVVIPVNTFLHEQEIAHIIADAQPKIIFVSDALATKITTANSSATTITELMINDMAQQSAQPFVVRELERDEMAVILYTSGTTGTPKGVMLSSNNIISNSAQGAARFDFAEQERLYCALPLFHSLTQNTCVWASALFGVTVILIPSITRTHLLAGFTFKPTIVIGVPGLFALFCRFKSISFASVRYIVSGGDALVDKVRMYFELIYGRKLCNGYGLSETSPFISVDFDDIISPTSTVGKPFVDIECALRDATTDGGHTIGVLWVKGPNVMLGYYNAPEATAKVLENGWFNTGDLARFDEHGKLVICGREKDLIAHKGIKIYPQELENILMAHPQVMMAAVIGVKNDLEEFPVAYIVLKEPLADASATLHTYCAQHLAAYKIPRQFIIVEALPLTPTGKIDKKRAEEKTGINTISMKIVHIISSLQRGGAEMALANLLRQVRDQEIYPRALFS